ncbi:MAG: diacylglycerol kinase, partial [Synergistaceae bacterium]|nr:diacylglycerol kinase [Synergistaceae bacterium]
MKYKPPLERIIKASKFSLRGLYFALKLEQAFRYEFIILIIILTASLLLKLNIIKALVLI